MSEAAQRQPVNVVLSQASQTTIRQVPFDPKAGGYTLDGRPLDLELLEEKLPDPKDLIERTQHDGLPRYFQHAAGGGVNVLVERPKPLGEHQEANVARVLEFHDHFDCSKACGGKCKHADAPMYRMDAKITSVMEDLVKAEDKPAAMRRFTQDVDALTISEARYISQMLGPQDQAISEVILTRLAREMKPEVIGNPLLRGIIVKEGWDGILQNLGVAEDVDGELIAVDGRSFIEGSGRKLTSLAYITAAIKPLTDDYEMGILKDGMHDFHQAYCKKWDMLRQTASEYSGDAKPSMKEYMAAFARQKHLLVIQRYESPVDIANETTDIHYNVSDFGIRRLLSDVVGGVYINLEETNTPKEIAKKLDAQFKAASKAVSGADLDADERERRKSLENAEFAEIRRMIEAADERDRNMDLEPNYEQKQLFADISTLFANPELFVSLSKAWSDNSPQKTG